MKIYRLAVDENGSPFVLNSKRISGWASLFFQHHCRIRPHQPDGLEHDRNEDGNQHESDCCYVCEP